MQSKKHKDCVQTLKAKKPTPTPAVQPSVLPAVEPSDEYRGKGKGRVDKGKGRAKDSSASSVKRRLSDVRMYSITVKSVLNGHARATS